MLFNIVVPDLFTTSKCNLRCKYCFEKKSNKKLDFEDFKEFTDNNCYLGFFMFGGEPLLETELIGNIIENTPVKRRKELKNIITNGTLIPKHIDFIKKYNLHMQISVDGPKHVHDMNRVYADGRGSYDDVIKAIKCCVDNDISWSLHGVCNKKTLPYFSEMLEWFYDIFKMSYEKKWIIDRMGENVIQIIFEEDYTDEDVDILIEQVYKIADWVNNKEGLSEEEKKELAWNIFNHTGGKCGAGTSLLALDTDLNIYPCHRMATIPNKDKYCLGNVYEMENFKNFKLYNLFFKTRMRGLYSAVKNIPQFSEKEKYRWINWCPSTNLQTSENIFYQNAKYNVMMTEVNRAIKDVIKKYDYRPRKRDNCSRHK